MALNYFIGREQTWLETKLKKLQEDLASGKTVTSVGAGDTSSSKQMVIPIPRALEMVLRALNILDPATYPINQIVGIDRTKATFS